jgi:hypothetical protein
MRIPESFISSLPNGVRPIPNEPLRFYVQSRGRSEVEHLVDLEEYGFNGKCSCEYYTFKIEPKLRQVRLDERTTMRLRCWHIRRAMYYLAELTMRAAANRDPRTRKQI